jgi:hypothetical protein
LTLHCFLAHAQSVRGSDGCIFLRQGTTFFDTFRHPTAPVLHAKTASIRKQKSGHWRVQVRRKGRSLSETFVRYDDAKTWGLEAERQIDRGETPASSRIAELRTFGELIDLHVEDMCAVGKAPRRSKAATLDQLKRELGSCNMVSLDRERLIRFGRQRAKQGAGPVTVSIDVGTIKLVLSHAAAVHGLQVRVDQIDLARIALKRLGLVGKGRERDRRPTQASWIACALTSTGTHAKSLRSAGLFASPWRPPCARMRSCVCVGAMWSPERGCS